MEADCTPYSRSVNKVDLARGRPMPHPRIIFRAEASWVEVRASTKCPSRAPRKYWYSRRRPFIPLTPHRSPSLVAHGVGHPN